MKFDLKKIRIFFLASTVWLAAIILYSAFTSYSGYKRNIPGVEEQSKLSQASQEQDDILLYSFPVSIPSPLLQTRNNFFKSFFYSKVFVFSPFSNFNPGNNCISFYKNESISDKPNPLRLHLTFCVFRI